MNTDGQWPLFQFSVWDSQQPMSMEATCQHSSDSGTRNHDDGNKANRSHFTNLLYILFRSV